LEIFSFKIFRKNIIFILFLFKIIYKNMSNDATIVTCFFDINREKKGDGRSISEYLVWIEKTLQLNCNLFNITEEKFRNFFLEKRPKEYKTYIKIIDFKELHYYKYYDRIKEIIESDYYKQKIAHPKRVECVLPEYNIIQYSKFYCLELAIIENPFQSEFFFWMDAGYSRFFQNKNLSEKYPDKKSNDLFLNNKNKIFIHRRYDLFSYKNITDFIWKSDNLLYGGMFGGDKNSIKTIASDIEEIFNEMISQNNVNNEQLPLYLVWKKKPELFYLLNTNHTLF